MHDDIQEVKIFRFPSSTKIFSTKHLYNVLTNKIQFSLEMKLESTMGNGLLKVGTSP